MAAQFWPELDGEHSRAALSEALRYLRRTLGDDVIASQGREEVGVDPAVVWCDAVAFESVTEASHSAGDPSDQLELYLGPFLDGVFVEDVAPELEQWIDETRARLRAHATRLAWAASAARELERDAPGAVRWGRQAVRLSPGDETGVRRLIALLDRTGDRAGALATYDAWRHEMRHEYDVAPSPETEAVARGVRERLVALGTGSAEVVPQRAAPQAPAPVTAGRAPTRRAMVALLVVAAGIVIMWVISLTRQPAAPPFSGDSPRLAVLPLVNATGDSTLRYLATGVGESIRRLLLKRSGVRTAPPGIVVALAAANASPVEIGRRLGVPYVLDWKLSRIGGVLAIEASLVQTASGSREFGRTYPFEPAAANQVEERVLGDLLERLGVPARSTEERTAAGRSHAGHLLELEADWHLQRRDVGHFRLARDLYLQAIELDPLDPDAYAGLANSYSGLAYYSALPPAEGFSLAEAAAKRALEIDPNNGRALGVLASALAAYRWDWPAAERAFQGAISVDPDDAGVRNFYGIMLRNLERYDEAIVQFREAARLEPLSRHYQRQIAAAIHCAGRYEAAIGEYRKALAIDSSYGNGWLYLSWGLAALRRYDESLVALRAAARADSDSYLMDALVTLRGELGYREAVRLIGARDLRGLDSLAQAGQYVSEVDFATALRMLGRDDEMYRRLAKGVDRRDVRALTFDCPVIAPLKPDPRWLAIRRRIGLR